MWQGGSGEALRAKLGDAQGEVDELSVQMERAGRALGDFSVALDGVRARLDQARTVASTAGLEVTDTIIVPPGEAPPPPPVDVPEDPALTQARTVHTAQVSAWNEAVETVADARNQESDAHDRLVTATNTPKGLADTVNTRNLAFAGIGAASGIPTSIVSERNKWVQQAERHHRLASWANEAIRGGRLPAEGRISVASMRAMEREFGASALRGVDRAASNSAVLERTIGSVAANFLLDTDPAAPRSTATGVARGALRSAGWVGAGAQAWMDIADGKPPDQAIISAGASTIAGGVVTSALLAAAPAAIAGGPVTLAAVGVGIVVSMGVGYVVDNHYDEMKDFVGDAVDTVKGWFG